MQVSRAQADFQIEYATRVFKTAKDAMKVQGQQTLQLIESAKTERQEPVPTARPGRGQLINVVA